MKPKNLPERTGTEPVESKAEQPTAFSQTEEPTVVAHAVELESLAEELRKDLPLDPYEAESTCAVAARRAREIAESAPETLPHSSATQPASDIIEIGPYKILGLLGQGGMGAVYKALHPRLDKIVALKVMVAGRLKCEHATSRFDREMKAVGKLDHPHLIRALDAGEADGLRYLAMEYVDGVDLSALIKKHGPLPIAEACELIIQAASALQAAHTRGMVHRDIKPANLMLARQEFGDPIVKVLDLGLALLAESDGDSGNGLTSDGQVMGTIDYMSPEQANDSHLVDIRADVYSLGATLYALISGVSVLGGGPNQSLTRKLLILANDPVTPIRERRPDVSPGLAVVIHKMLAKEPGQRYATPGEVITALKPFAVGARLARLDRADVANGPMNQTSNSVSRTPLVESHSAASVTAATEVSEPRGLPAKRRIPVMVTSVILAMGAALAGIAMMLRTPHGDIVIEIPDNVPPEVKRDLKISVTGDGNPEIASAQNGWKINVVEGAYAIKVVGDNDLVTIENDRLTVTRNKLAIVTVKLKASTPASQPQPAVPAGVPETIDGISVQASRKFAKWLQTFDPQASFIGNFVDNTPFVVKPGEPLPEKPFRFNSFNISGKPIETRGDKYLEELAAHIRGMRPEALEIASHSPTTAGITALVRLPEYDNLRGFAVTNKSVDDSIIAAVGHCKFLNGFSIHDSERFTGKGIGTLQSVAYLSFLNCPNLSTDAMEELRNLPNLEYLNIHAPTFTGKTVEVLASLKLKQLLMNAVQVDDHSAASIAEMQTLQNLSIGNCQLTDKGLAEFGKLKDLQRLQFSGTKVTAEGVAELKKILPNCKIGFE